MHDPMAYTRNELVELGDKFPIKGKYCKKCSAYIPIFLDLDAKTQTRVLALILNNQSMLAMSEIISVTGCSLRMAKIWVTHKGEPTPDYPGPPCLFCGKPLVTSLAKQCDFCLMDWHDPDNPITLKRV